MFLPGKPAPKAHQKAAGRHSGKAGQFGRGQIFIAVTKDAAHMQACQKAAGHAEKHKRAIDGQQPAYRSVAHGIVYSRPQGWPQGVLLFLRCGKRHAEKHRHTHSGSGHVNPEGGAQGARDEHRARCGRSGELHRRLHSSVHPVKAHALVLGHQERDRGIDGRRLQAGAHGTDHRQYQKRGQKRHAFGKQRHQQDHHQRYTSNAQIRSRYEPLAGKPVRPHAADEGNGELRQIGADAEGSHPCPRARRNRGIPYDGHLYQRRAEKGDALTDEKQGRVAFPVLFHLTTGRQQTRSCAGWGNQTPPAARLPENSGASIPAGSRGPPGRARERWSGSAHAPKKACVARP